MEKTKIIEAIENDHEEGMGYATDASDVLIKAAKVYTKDCDLNSDSVLSNLDKDMPKLMKYIIEQQNMIAILHSYLKVNHTIIKLDNEIGDNWMKEIVFQNPNKNTYFGIKRIFMNRIQSMVILSRSRGGATLKAFLKYNKPETTDKELGMEKQMGMWDKMTGAKPKEDI